MKVEFYVVDTQTHEDSTYTADFEDTDILEFMCDEGNYSCDCNRELFFLRGRDMDDTGPCECGDERFLMRVTDEEGNEIYNDLDV